MAETGLECEVLCKLSGMNFMWGILCPNFFQLSIPLPPNTAPVLLLFEPVGRWFESHDSRVRLLSSEGVACPEGSSSESEGEGGSDEEVNALLLDPTQWKVRLSSELASYPAVPAFFASWDGLVSCPDHTPPPWERCGSCAQTTPLPLGRGVVWARD